MHAAPLRPSKGNLAFLFLIPALAFAPCAHTQQPPASQPAEPASSAPAVAASTSDLAHKILEAGLKANSLGGEGLAPWHLKLDFQVLVGRAAKLTSGTLEQWTTGPNQWRRTFTSKADWFNGSEWSFSHVEHYQSRALTDGFDYVLLNLRIAGPVLDPLYQAAKIKPEYEMQLKRLDVGVILNCVLVGDTSHVAPDKNTGFKFPTMCFDTDSRLRLMSSGDTVIQFGDFQIFQNRFVAKDVKVLVAGNLIAEMKVSLLEPLSASDAALVKPDKKAIPQPYIPEPGDPKVESVYEFGAEIPLSPERKPFFGVMPVQVVIQKDGSVKVLPSSAWNQGQLDAVQDAVKKWKYKPYIVDGQPVELGVTILYDVPDNKPYIPTYERPKTAPVVTAATDFSSAYDPKRDPTKDLAMAEVQARQSHKRILLDVGGDWCIWCKQLDKFYADHQDVRALRDVNFVPMKVNMSSENENREFLSQFPRIPGYPFIFVLDEHGKMLRAERTGELEDGAGGYNVRAFKEFLDNWKPMPVPVGENQIDTVIH
ncbi:MAG: thioredoxin family protein [Terracidiphilus sp.]